MAFPGVACPPQLWQNGPGAMISPIPSYYSPVKTVGSPVLPSPGSPFENMSIVDHNGQSGADSPAYSLPPKQAVKRQRRRRCGNCEGCQRTENCGRCSVCTNSNATSNSICKNRRCITLLKTRRPSTLVSMHVRKWSYYYNVYTCSMCNCVQWVATYCFPSWQESSLITCNW